MANATIPNADNSGDGPVNEISGIDDAGTIPVTSLAEIAADEFARDANGDIIRRTDGKPAKKRGRKAGTSPAAATNPKTESRKTATNKNANLAASLDSLSGVLVILHAGIAAATKTPEIELDEDESKQLAKAVSNVMDQFDFAPDPKVTAIVGLVTTAGVIYAPKIVLIRARNAAEKAERKSSRNPEQLDNPNENPEVIGHFSPGLGFGFNVQG